MMEDLFLKERVATQNQPGGMPSDDFLQKFRRKKRGRPLRPVPWKRKYGKGKTSSLATDWTPGRSREISYELEKERRKGDLKNVSPALEG